MTFILCLNVGSSSIKVAAFEDENEVPKERMRQAFDPDPNPGFLGELSAGLRHDQPDVVAHRFVHGGPNHDKGAVIDETLVRELENLIPLAPLHLPPALQMLELARAKYPNARHVACFDTAFHFSIPPVARTYPLPQDKLGTVVRRYGFHGLSCEHVVGELGLALTQRCVIAHLGSGCSVTAIRNGHAIDTSMGFTPSGGVIMATRPGDLDPGLLLYLLRHGEDVESLSEIVNHKSGLVSIAGSPDIQVLLDRSQTDKDAELAIDMFCYRLAQQIGAYAVTLGGMDTLAFTGGIGEHSELIRTRVLEALQLLKPFEAVVVPANEEVVMARQAISTITDLPHSPTS